MLSSLLASWRWGEDGELGPGIFSLFHIAWIFIVVGLCILFGRIAHKKHDPKRDDVVIFCIDLVLIVLEVLKHLMYDAGYYHYIRFDILPFSYCSIPLFVALVGSLVPNARIKEACYRFLAFFGIIGGIASTIYPVSLESYFVFTSFHTMIWHTALCVMGVYLIVARGYGKSFRREIVSPTVLFILLTLFAVVLNEVAYFAFLKPMQTPSYSPEYMPGSYEYYKFGYAEDGTYHLLSDKTDTPSLTDNYPDTANVVLVLAEGSDSSFDLTFTDADGTEHFVVIVETESGKEIRYADVPGAAWTFDYSGTHPALVTTFADGDYTMDFTGGAVGAALYQPSESTLTEGSFVKASVEREGDSANFFFISNHYDTPIPVLATMQHAVPYPVFIAIYMVSVVALASGIWGVVFLCRRPGKKHQSPTD